MNRSLLLKRLMSILTDLGMFLVHVCVNGHMYRPKLLSQEGHPLKQGLSSPWNSPIRLDWLARKGPVSSSPALRFQCALPSQHFKKIYVCICTQSIINLVILVVNSISAKTQALQLASFPGSSGAPPNSAVEPQWRWSEALGSSPLSHLESISGLNTLSKLMLSCPSSKCICFLTSFVGCTWVYVFLCANGGQTSTTYFLNWDSCTEPGAPLFV